MLTPLLLSAAIAAASGQATEFEAVISVASRAEQPAREVAGTVSLIERERLDQMLVQDIADAVRYEPGVSAPEDAARFGLSGFSIRGLSGNRVGIEIDGVPVADGFAIGSFSNASRGAIETEFLARMEILRGPASTLYGSDALAGVVSLRTLSPDDLLAGRESPIGVRAGAEGLSRDGSLATSLLSGWRVGRFELLAGGVRREAGERENQPRDGGLESNPAERRDASELMKLGFDAGAGGRFGLMLDRTHETAETNIRSLVYGPGQYATTNRMDGDDDFRRERLSLSGAWSFARPGFDELVATVYGQRSRTEQRTLQWRDAAPPRTPPTFRDRRFLYKTDAQGMDLQATGRFSALGAEHWQVFGIEYSKVDLSELRDARETNLSTGAVTNVLIGERFPVRDFPPSLAREFGAFWQDEMRWANGLALIPGLRYERFRVDARADAIYREDNPNLAVADIAESQLTPKLGLRYEFSRATQLFAQYAHGFRAPPAADVNVGFTIPAFNYIAIPNPDLKPERSRGIEIGLRHSAGWGSLEAVGYFNRYQDLIESRVNLGRDPVSNALIFQSINRAEAEIIGLELRSEVVLPFDGFSLQGALAWTRGKDTARKVPLNSVEPAKLTLGLVYENLGGDHRYELVATAVAGKDRLDDPRSTLFRTPGYATLDAYWQWRPIERIQVDVGVFNLTDRRYWLWSGVGGLPADAREIDLYTQPGRQYGASVRYLW